jgi:hypothetical protein
MACSNLLKNEPQTTGSAGIGPHDEGIVHVLQDRARHPIGERVKEPSVELDEPLQHVGGDEEEVRRQRVSLPKPTHAADPFPWNAIEHDGRAGGREDHVHPFAP